MLWAPCVDLGALGPLLFDLISATSFNQVEQKSATGCAAALAGLPLTTLKNHLAGGVPIVPITAQVGTKMDTGAPRTQRGRRRCPAAAEQPELANAEGSHGQSLPLPRGSPQALEVRLQTPPTPRVFPGAAAADADAVFCCAAGTAP